MQPSLRPYTNTPASILLLLTVLFIVTPRNVHAQRPTPSQSADNDIDLSGYKYLGIAIAVLVGLGLLCGCCSHFCNPAGARKTPVRDVERQPAVPSDPMQGQGVAPAFPPKAHIKEDVLNVGAMNDEEPGPPPYYPPPPFPPPMSVPQKTAMVPNRGAPMMSSE